MASLPPCPVQARQGRLAAHSYLDLRLEVTIKDSAGRNIDSLRGVKVDWAVSDQSLGSVVEAEGVLQDREKTAHQVLRVRHNTGPVDITATIATCKALHIRCSVISLAAEVRIYR